MKQHTHSAEVGVQLDEDPGGMVYTQLLKDWRDLLTRLSPVEVSMWIFIYVQFEVRGGSDLCFMKRARRFGEMALGIRYF